MASNLAQQLRLMLVTDDRLLAGRDLVDLARRAVRGGVTAVQLRLKQASARELVDLARALRAAVPVPVLVNDRPDVAFVAGAGVHLGPDDLPVELARRLLPPPAIVGASAGTLAEAEGARGADYWGVGPWHATGTKADAGGAIGAAGFRAIVAVSGGIPCVAIGGIRPEDVPAVLGAGGVGVAVVSGILAADDVEAAARAYARMFGEGGAAGAG
ncbi:MAG: thiamine phosphate synthase [Gemmatimonadales bacterium]|nr:thiamine phosphate synthase [Gemmatimonadales bacterium]